MRLIIFALMLALSGPPPPTKEGSFCVEPHPTIPRTLVHMYYAVGIEGHTPREEAVFGEDCYCVYEKNRDCANVSVDSRWVIVSLDDADLGIGRQNLGVESPSLTNARLLLGADRQKRKAQQ
jgi:hypothetical protein